MGDLFLLPLKSDLEKNIDEVLNGIIQNLPSPK